MKNKDLTPDDQAMNDWFNRNKSFVFGLLTFLVIGLATIIFLIIK